MRKIVLGVNFVGFSKVVKKVVVNVENGLKKVVIVIDSIVKRVLLNGIDEKRFSLNRMKNIFRNK